MTHAQETKTVLISGFSVAAIEAVSNMGFEQIVQFSIQSTIGILTVLYLIIKIYKTLKTKHP